MDSPSLRLECLKLAVQTATAESLDKSQRAPDIERVATLTETFYALVEGTVVVELVKEIIPEADLQSQSTKKPKTDKDKIFS